MRSWPTTLVVFITLGPAVANADAQVRATYNPGPAQIRDYYNQTSMPSPTVSPYLNLGVNPNGLSNYQTLVRPMVNDRDALRAQTGGVQFMPQPGRARVASQTRNSSDAKPRPNARFMHYSHFFGGADE
ncbi:MAG TPA: hypothetical protein VGJ16_12340 [Pirellulales bacterium]|jgi:hypothetical protein